MPSFFGDVAGREMSLLCLNWLRRQLLWQKLSVVAMPCLQAQPGLGEPVAAGTTAAGWGQGRSVPAGSSVAMQPPLGEWGLSASPGSQQTPSKLPASSHASGLAPILSVSLGL